MPKKLTLKTKERQDLETALQVSMVPAVEDKSLGFLGRDFVLATLPHRRVKGVEFVRKNGAFTLTVTTPSQYGIPFGVIPRLILVWLSEEAVRRKVSDEENPTQEDRRFVLGESLGAFLAELGLNSSGGPRGDITRFRKQILSLTESTISATWDGKVGSLYGHRSYGGKVSEITEFWWDAKRPEQKTLWDNFVIISPNLFRSLRDHAVPFDKRILKSLKQSPLALDIYVWLTYRMYSLEATQTIPWGSLVKQFGSAYAETPEGTRNFRKAFRTHLGRILKLYRARVEANESALVLKPSATSIPKVLS